MKPDTGTAMRELIAQVRAAMPFGAAQADTCGGSCDGCSQKLLQYLESELEGWERRLGDGEKPSLGDLSRLAKSATKIYAVLERNGVVAALEA